MKDITYAFKIIGETKQGDVKSLIKNIGFKMYQHLVAMLVELKKNSTASRQI